MRLTGSGGAGAKHSAQTKIEKVAISAKPLSYFHCMLIDANHIWHLLLGTLRIST